MTGSTLSYTCESRRQYMQDPDPAHGHWCRKQMRHRGRHRCGCFGGKCRVSWKTVVDRRIK